MIQHTPKNEPNMLKPVPHACTESTLKPTDENRKRMATILHSGDNVEPVVRLQCIYIIYMRTRGSVERHVFACAMCVCVCVIAHRTHIGQTIGAR